MVGPHSHVMISCDRDTRYILPFLVWVGIAKYSNESEHRSYPFPAPGKWGGGGGRATLSLGVPQCR
jgi:hypothetical protein